ncbi:MAG TPA: GNAT family N-acetyltransferase, partial [Acidimicrobiales bacterium]|nr:GNAT family N-acetyltransferase [Acidimicrobiales bacterium]
MASTALPIRRSATGWETLRNGRRVFIRPIQIGDADALVAFHEHLSDATRRWRFFTLHPHLSADEVARFTNVDHHRREALVAFSAGRLVGVGRFDATSDSSGEVAFVVADNRQAEGLGSRLLERLADWASDRGYTRLEADVLGGNTAMLRVFARYAPDRRVSFDSGVVHLEMPVTPRPVAAARSRVDTAPS